MSKELYKNYLLLILLLFFYYKQKKDINVYLNYIINQFNNIKYLINNYSSIISNKNKNKNILKKNIDDLENIFLKNNTEHNEKLNLKEDNNIVEITLHKKINTKDYNIIDLYSRRFEIECLKEPSFDFSSNNLVEESNDVDIELLNDVKKIKKSNSILNFLLNKYVIISIILIINYYKKTIINKFSINYNKKSDKIK